jgi:Spy/CpxP family protein refolding chaperone
MLKRLPALFVRTATGAALVMLACPPGAAEARSHKWWQSEDVQAELGLTNKQSTEAEQIFQTAWPRLKTVKGTLDRLEEELSRTIAEGTAAEAAVAQQVDKVEAARSELGKLRTLMLFRLNKILTAEQRVKLKAYHDRRERERDGSSRQR